MHKKEGMYRREKDGEKKAEGREEGVGIKEKGVCPGTRGGTRKWGEWNGTCQSRRGRVRETESKRK